MSSVLNQSLSFFDARNSLRYKSLFQTQFDPSTPGVPNLDSGTSLLVPDYRVEEQLSHFPEELYDLRPESHLVRLMKALLGDSGAGQLRKRYMMARLQTVMSSTHFFDLDAFYGAIFGINRRRSEVLRFNPYRSLATPDEWDRAHASDSSFRERIVALAKAIPMGATPRGMQTAAEAITGTPCDVVENWARMDYYRLHGYDIEAGLELQPELVHRRWSQVQTKFPTYASMYSETVPDWDAVEYGFEMPEQPDGLPRLINDRTGFVIRPRTHYTDSEIDQQNKAEDALAIRQVVNVLKPAGSLLTLNMRGVNQHAPLPIRSYAADSEHWEIISEVEPYAAADVDLVRVYPRSAEQVAIGVEPSGAHVLPRPPFTGTAGEGWSYNTEVITASSYTLADDGAIKSDYAFELVTHYDGTETAYTPALAVMDPQQAESSRLAGDGSLLCSPYSQERVLVTTHD